MLKKESIAWRYLMGEANTKMHVLPLLKTFLKNKPAQSTEIFRYCWKNSVHYMWEKTFRERLDRLVGHGQLLRIKLKSGSVFYALLDWSNGFNLLTAEGRLVASDYAEEQGDLEKATMLREAVYIKGGPYHANHTNRTQTRDDIC